MADIQIHVQIAKEQPINVSMADSEIIQVAIIKEQPVNVAITEPVNIEVILDGQIGIKGDKGDASDIIYDSMRYDVDNDPIFYIGEALLSDALESDNVWRIKKTIVSGDSIIILWANGNQNLTNVWDQRLNLSYS
jgi:hypothetical protein